MTEPNANVIFETLGELYYSRYHRLRPGKDEPAASYRNSGDDENTEQYRKWYASGTAMIDAVARIVELTEELEERFVMARIANYTPAEIKAMADKVVQHITSPEIRAELEAWNKKSDEYFKWLKEAQRTVECSNATPLVSD